MPPFYYLFGNAYFDLCHIPQSNGRAFTTISSSTTNKQVQSECSQESSHQNANQDSVEEEQIPDSLERYESILVKEQLKEVKRKGTP